MRRISPSRASRFVRSVTGDEAEPQAVKRSERVYLESYTSILMVPKERLVSVHERRSQQILTTRKHSTDAR